MLFNSYEFLLIFIPLVLLFYYRIADRQKNLVLAVSGYIFYAFWDHRFCVLLLASTLWDFFIGKMIFQSSANRIKKRYVILSVLLNLGMLGYFKYYNFFIESFLSLFPFVPLRQANIILPVGISFFTFQSMSYSIEIYQGHAKPVRTFIDFACYISMFPQLVAGPIVRYSRICGQLSSRQHSVDRIAHGMRRFIIGLSKKVLIADSLAGITDKLFLISEPGFGEAWLGAISFSLQIYFDFSGYSDMAIGLGRLFGFELPENFNFPYKARGIYDFWRKWHISLSDWLKNFLYIPLGGSKGSASRTRLNLFITMLLCGLWHGAAWRFILWGGYHAVLMAMERPYRGKISRSPAVVSIPVTYLAVVTGWVFFRSHSLQQAIFWIRGMAGLNGDSTDIFTRFQPSVIWFVVMVQSACWVFPACMDRRWQFPVFSRDVMLTLLFLVSLAVILCGDNTPFLYFQF